MKDYRISSEVADIIVRDVLWDHIQYMQEDIVKYESMMDAGEALAPHQAENYAHAKTTYVNLSNAFKYFGG